MSISEFLNHRSRSRVPRAIVVGVIGAVATIIGYVASDGYELEHHADRSPGTAMLGAMAIVLAILGLVAAIVAWRRRYRDEARITMVLWAAGLGAPACVLLRHLLLF